MRTFKLAALLIAATPLAANRGAGQCRRGCGLAGPLRRQCEARRIAQAGRSAEFLGLKRGMHVIDLFGGNAYWAEIMAPAVGPKGHVLVWEPTQFYERRHPRRRSPSSWRRTATFRSSSTPFEAPVAAEELGSTS